jgi:hypothetical protein
MTYADGTVNYRVALVSGGQVYTGTFTNHLVNVQVNNTVIGTWSTGGLSINGQVTASGTAFYNAGITAGPSAGNLIFGGSPGAAVPLWLRPVWNIDNGFSVSAAGDCQVRGNGTLLTFTNGPGTFTCVGVMSMPNVYNNTIAGSANVIVGTAGEMRRATSSRRYKTDIVDYPKGLAELLKLRPVSFRPLESAVVEEDDPLGGKTHTGDDRVYAGLIAEEVDEAGFTEYVEYDAEGRPDGLFYPTMVALLVNAISELTTRIEALEGAG